MGNVFAFRLIRESRICASANIFPRLQPPFDQSRICPSAAFRSIAHLPLGRIPPFDQSRICPSAAFRSIAHLPLGRIPINHLSPIRPLFVCSIFSFIAFHFMI
jgi:hypothetical protein